MERGSIASFGSGGTTDSEHPKDKGCETWVLSDYSATSSNEITVQRGQQVEVLEPSSSSTSMILVRLYGQKEEGLVPQSCLKQPTGGFKYRNARDEDSNATTDKASAGGNFAASKKKGGFSGIGNGYPISESSLKGVPPRNLQMQPPRICQSIENPPSLISSSLNLQWATSWANTARPRHPPAHLRPRTVWPRPL